MADAPLNKLLDYTVTQIQGLTTTYMESENVYRVVRPDTRNLSGTDFPCVQVHFTDEYVDRNGGTNARDVEIDSIGISIFFKPSIEELDKGVKLYNYKELIKQFFKEKLHVITPGPDYLEAFDVQYVGAEQLIKTDDTEGMLSMILRYEFVN